MNRAKVHEVIDRLLDAAAGQDPESVRVRAVLRRALRRTEKEIATFRRDAAPLGNERAEIIAFASSAVAVAPAGVGFVYCIQGIEGGPIKIGRAIDVRARINELQVASPVDLVTLVAFPGGAATERCIHDRFRAARLRGEWFYPTEGLLLFVRTARIAVRVRGVELAQGARS